jgi:sugar phosphate isomerase/epimerase
MKNLKHLKLALAFVAGVVAVNAVASPNPVITKARPVLVGLQLYTVRDDCAKDFPGVLRAVAKMGFTGVEFAGYYGRTAEELKQMLDEDHLVCYGSHVPWADLQGDKFEKTIAFNKTLGNHLIVIPWIPSEMRNTRETLIQTAHKLGDLAKRVEKEGLILGYHNHMDEFHEVEGEMPWYTLFGNSGNSLAIQFDTGNAMSAGAQAAPFLLKYPKRVISMHVKDFSKSNPNAMLGEGDENWTETLKVLKTKVHPRWFIIEQETYPISPLASAEKCLRNFEKMWASN